MQKPGGAFRAWAIAVAIELLDLQLQMSNQRLVVGLPSARDGDLRASNDQCRLQRLDIVWQGFRTGAHDADRIIKPAICGDFFLSFRTFLSLSRALRPPRMLRVSPVDAFEQVTQLRGRDDNRIILGGRPDEAALFQALGVERGAQPVVPKNLNELTALASEDIKIARMRIASQRLLDAQSQRVHAAAHIGVTGRDPDPHP
jgi:hypothetical protein